MSVSDEFTFHLLAQKQCADAIEAFTCREVYRTHTLELPASSYVYDTRLFQNLRPGVWGGVGGWVGGCERLCVCVCVCVCVLCP